MLQTKIKRKAPRKIKETLHQLKLYLPLPSKDNRVSQFVGGVELE